VEGKSGKAAREVMESEKPRTITFNLNQNPKYDTGLVAVARWTFSSSRCYSSVTLHFRRRPCGAKSYQTAKAAGFVSASSTTVRVTPTASAFPKPKK